MTEEQGQSKSASKYQLRSVSYQNENCETDISTFQPTLRTYLAFYALCVVVLTESLDGTSIGVILPSIAQAIKSSTTATFSLGTSFLLASTIFQPVFTSLSYIFGRKPVLLVALVLFLTGAVIAALAKGVTVLLIGRCVQGIGAAGSITLTVVTLTDIVPLRQRAKWIGGLNAIWAIGSVSGPVIGGAFVRVTWRWIFWINVPLVATSFTCIALFLHLRVPKGPHSSKLIRIDYIGIILFLSSTTAFLIPLTFAGTVCPWSSWRILLPFILGITGFVIFIFYQRSIASNPMIRLSVFANPTANIGHAGTLVHGILLWMLLYYLPLYYEGVLEYSPMMTGIAAFPETFTVAPAAIVTGLAISKCGRYRWALWAGWLITTLGMGLLCLLDINTSIQGWVFINLVPGLGLGMLVPAESCSIQAATSSADAGYAIAMYSLIRASGQTVGVAIGGAVFRNTLSHILQNQDMGADVTVEGLVEVIRGLHGDSPDKIEVKKAIVEAMKMVWAVGCALAGFAALSMVWVKELSLDKGLETEHSVNVGERGVECVTETGDVKKNNNKKNNS